MPSHHYSAVRQLANALAEHIALRHTTTPLMALERFEGKLGEKAESRAFSSFGMWKNRVAMEKDEKLVKA